MILHTAETLKRYTESGHLGRRTLLDLLRETAAKAPERPAVVDPADRPDLTGTAAQNLSYREFAAAVDAIATELMDMGLRKDEIVVVQLPNIWELVAMFLAVSRAGGVLSPMPIQWRDNEFQNVKKLTEARFFFFGMRDFKGADQLAIAEKTGFVALPIERIAEMARGAADVARLDAIGVDARAARRGPGAGDRAGGQHDRCGHLAGFAGHRGHDALASPAEHAAASQAVDA